MSGFTVLKFSDFPAPAGTWYSLLDSDTDFSRTRPDHRWILYIDYDPGRYAFAHGCPRSTSEPRPGNVFVEHPAHDVGHEPDCLLDLDARVYISSGQQLEPAWFDNGRYSCTEPDSKFVALVQLKMQEGAR